MSNALVLAIAVCLGFVDLFGSRGCAAAVNADIANSIIAEHEQTITIQQAEILRANAEINKANSVITRQHATIAEYEQAFTQLRHSNQANEIAKPSPAPASPHSPKSPFPADPASNTPVSLPLPQQPATNRHYDRPICQPS